MVHVYGARQVNMVWDPALYTSTLGSHGVALAMRLTSALAALAASATVPPATVPRQSVRLAAFSEDVTLEQLRQEQKAFVDERDWSQFHTPRSLALALVGEVGEVCEVLQWRGDAGVAPGLLDWTPDERTALSDELADVLSYVLRLADVCDIDLPAAFIDKLAKNRAKYPAEVVRGSAAKYTTYRTAARAEAAAAAADAATAAVAQEPPPGADDSDGQADSGESDPWERAAAAVEAQNRAYERAQKRAAEKWAAMQGEAAPPTLAEAADGAVWAPGGSWASSNAAPASVYAAEQAEAAAAETAADAASVGSDVQRRAAARAEAKFAELSGERAAKSGSAEPEDGTSSNEEATAPDALEVESLDDLWAMMEFDGPGGESMF